MAKKITYQDDECYVEYANKDSKGNVINDTYQEKLISGTNIKTIDSNSLIGSGNITTQKILNNVSHSTFASTTSSRAVPLSVPTLYTGYCHLKMMTVGTTKILIGISTSSFSSTTTATYMLYNPEIIHDGSYVFICGFNSNNVYVTYSISKTSSIILYFKPLTTNSTIVSLIKTNAII
jgi:hypothetical protein